MYLHGMLTHFDFQNLLYVETWHEKARWSQIGQPRPLCWTVADPEIPGPHSQSSARNSWVCLKIVYP